MTSQLPFDCETDKSPSCAINVGGDSAVTELTGVGLFITDKTPLDSAESTVGVGSVLATLTGAAFNIVGPGAGI